MNKFLLLTLFLYLIVNDSGAQVLLERQVMASGGGHASATGVILSYTIGEPAILTLTNASAILTQGFQQPAFITVGLPDPYTDLQSLNIFPNPVTDQLNISIQSSKSFEALISLFDLTGRLVMPEQLFPVMENISLLIRLDLQSLAPAAYLVRISDTKEHRTISHTRIVKTN